VPRCRSNFSPSARGLSKQAPTRIALPGLVEWAGEGPQPDLVNHHRCHGLAFRPERADGDAREITPHDVADSEDAPCTPWW
jgi:hypothetical protein